MNIIRYQVWLLPKSTHTAIIWSNVGLKLLASISAAFSRIMRKKCCQIIQNYILKDLHASVSGQCVNSFSIKYFVRLSNDTIHVLPNYSFKWTLSKTMNRSTVYTWFYVATVTQKRTRNGVIQHLVNNYAPNIPPIFNACETRYYVVIIKRMRIDESVISSHLLNTSVCFDRHHVKANTRIKHFQSFHENWAICIFSCPGLICWRWSVSNHQILYGYVIQHIAN